MINQIKYNFLIPSSGSGISDDYWRLEKDKILSTTKLSSDLLKYHQYKYNGYKIKIEADWSPKFKSYHRYYKTLSEFKDLYKRSFNEEKIMTVLNKFQKTETNIPITAYVETSNADKSPPIFGAVKSYLHDYFLILNLAAPGCCNFYRSKLRQKDPPASRTKSTNPAEVSLSSDILILQCSRVTMANGQIQVFCRLKTSSLG